MEAPNIDVEITPTMQPATAATDPKSETPHELNLKAAEERLIREAMRTCTSISSAARCLGLTVWTLRRRLHKLGMLPRRPQSATTH